MCHLTKNMQMGDHLFLILGTFLLCLSFFGIASSAEQPTATISSLNGSVQVTLQGKEAVAAAVGMALRSGDTIQTLSGAGVVLALSEGSELQLGENTNLDIATLAQEPATGARTSRIKLLWGRIRAVLSPGHQHEGSSFSVETPNALAGVKFSHPIIEVGYDPITDTTTIDAQTVDVIVTNLKTQRFELIRKGQRGIVRKDTLLSTLSPREAGSLNGQPIPPQGNVPEQLPPQLQKTLPPVTKGVLPLRTDVFNQTRMGVRQAIGTTVPLSLGPVGARGPGKPGVPMPGEGGGIDMLPGFDPGFQPDSPEARQRRMVIIHLREQ
jgi:hypothetical protein